MSKPSSTTCTRPTPTALRALAPLVLLAAASTPTVAHATQFTFQSDCAADLAIDLGAAGPAQPLLSGVALYSIQPVTWEGVTLAGLLVGRQNGVTLYALVDVGLTMSPLSVQYTTSSESIEPPTTFTEGTWTGTAGSCPITAILEGDPLDAAVVTMQALANAHYAGSDPVQASGPARLRPASFRDELAEVRGLLQGAGCTVNASGHLSGAYRGGSSGTGTGEDEGGAVLDAVLRGRQNRITGSIDGFDVGDPIGAWDPDLRFVLSEGDEFYIGKAEAVAGRRGVFMALRASCPFGSSPETALDVWFDGELDGLDITELGPVDLGGEWSVALDCGTGTTLPDTWSFTESASGVYTVSSLFVDTAVAIQDDAYQLSGPAGSFGPVFGALFTTGPNSFEAQISNALPIPCSASGTRTGL